MKRKILNYMSEHYWNIGFIETKECAQIDIKEQEIKWMKHNYQNKGWFADPFILNYDDNEIVVLVEEFNYGLKRGIISKLVIDRGSFVLKHITPLLTLDSHLSFPNILREDNKTYIYPENGTVGVLNLYELKDECNLEFVRTLVNDRLSDATIYKDERGYFILATIQPDDNKDELVIYHSENLSGNFAEYKRIKFPDCSARNAGAIVTIGEKIYKVSQDCNGGYGKGIKVYEMSKDFDFKHINSFYLKEKPIDGMHTYNRYKDLAVVDLHAPRRPMLYSLFLFLLNIKKRLTRK